MVSPSPDVSLAQVSPLASGQNASSDLPELQDVSEANTFDEDEDSSQLFKSDDEDEIENLLNEAEELATKKPTSSEKKVVEAVTSAPTSSEKKVEKVTEPLTSAPKKAVEEVGSSFGKASQSEKTKVEELPEVEDKYEEEEWDSEDESDDEEEEEEEETGTALAWLSNTALADPFSISPPRSPQHSPPPSPRSSRKNADKKEPDSPVATAKEPEKKKENADSAMSSNLGSPKLTPVKNGNAESAVSSNPGSPKLEPLSAHSSLQSLPPLSLSPSRSGRMSLPPLRVSPSHEKRLTPKKTFMEELLSQQDTSPSGTSETESEWEKEAKAKRTRPKATPPVASEVLKEQAAVKKDVDTSQDETSKVLAKSGAEKWATLPKESSTPQEKLAAPEFDSEDETVEEVIEEMEEDEDKEDGDLFNSKVADSLSFSPHKSLSSTPTGTNRAELSRKSVTFTTPDNNDIITFYSDEEEKVVEKAPSLSLLDAELGNPTPLKVSSMDKEIGDSLKPKVTFENLQESKQELSELNEGDKEEREDFMKHKTPAKETRVTKVNSLTTTSEQKSKFDDSLVRKSEPLPQVTEPQKVEEKRESLPEAGEGRELERKSEAPPKQLEKKGQPLPQKVEQKQLEKMSELLPEEVKMKPDKEIKSSGPLQSVGESESLSNEMLGSLQNKIEEGTVTPVISGPNLPLGARPISAHPGTGRGIQRNASISDSHLELNQSVGGVGRRGLSRLRNTDDTDDDFTATTLSTESDVSDYVKYDSFYHVYFIRRVTT